MAGIPPFVTTDGVRITYPNGPRLERSIEASGNYGFNAGVSCVLADGSKATARFVMPKPGTEDYSRVKTLNDHNPYHNGKVMAGVVLKGMNIYSRTLDAKTQLVRAVRAEGCSGVALRKAAQAITYRAAHDTFKFKEVVDSSFTAHLECPDGKTLNHNLSGGSDNGSGSALTHKSGHNVYHSAGATASYLTGGISHLADIIDQILIYQANGNRDDSMLAFVTPYQGKETLAGDLCNIPQGA